MNGSGREFVLTAAQMREADRRCIEDIGIPGVVLMNTAGGAVFAEVNNGPITVVCGKGNNGGDGYVVARMALEAEMDVDVVVLADPDEIQGDALIFLAAYLNLGGRVRFTNDPKAVATLLDELADRAVLVDAMLGTGVKGALREPFKTAVQRWPDVHTIAVDIPSGLDADTGEPGDGAICADVTVTFQCAKAGFRERVAAPYLGRLVIADIGIPTMCLDDRLWAQRPRA